MNKFLIATVAALFSLTSIQAISAPVDDGPPAQVQKDAVPDSTKNGNYLEPQPGDTAPDAQKADSKKHDSKKSKSKGKNVTDKPADGGVDVNQR